ncbi:MAG: hypothetical protein MJK15_18420 [Colwellia sp.]|nr:hypothetical protein [Colwellia sp.]
MRKLLVVTALLCVVNYSQAEEKVEDSTSTKSQKTAITHSETFLAAVKNHGDLCNHYKDDTQVNVEEVEVRVTTKNTKNISKSSSVKFNCIN